MKHPIGRIRAVVLVVVGATLVTLALPSVAGALTRPQANKVALAALRPSAKVVVIYGLPRPLRSSQTVVQEGTGRRSLAPPGRQWVFFEDLVPGAYFDHPGRLLFVSDRTGRVSASIATHSYPLIGGRALFLEPGVPGRYRVFARPASGVSFATRRPARSSRRIARAAAIAFPPSALAGECILTVGDRGPDRKNFGPDLNEVKTTAAVLGIPVYPLPNRKDGSAPDGTDLPDYAATLAKKGCKDILIFVAGHGKEPNFPGGNIPGTIVAYDADTNTNRFVSPVNLRDTLHFNPKITFKIVLDSCYSGRFVPLLPPSFKNLLVLSVSSSATEPSFGGDITDLVVGDTPHHNDNAKPYSPSGFVKNFTTGWETFATSPTEVAAAQAAGGSLFAHMIARGQALGGGQLDWPASVGATHPMTYVLNLGTATTSSSLKACAIQTSPTQDEVKVGEQGQAGAEGAVLFNAGGTPQARTFILGNTTPIPDAFVGPFTAPTSGFATITISLTTLSGASQTFNLTIPANSQPASDCPLGP
jgi:hypothetical protein